MGNSSLFSLYKALFDAYPAPVLLCLQRDNFHAFYAWHGAGRSVDSVVMYRHRAQGLYPSAHADADSFYFLEISSNSTVFKGCEGR